jgi:hypothetical protein
LAASQGDTQDQDVPQTQSLGANIEDVLSFMIGMVGAAQYARLADCIKFWEAHPLVVATACTGTDVAMMVLSKLAKLLAKELGGIGNISGKDRELRVQYVFACEIAGTKRAWADAMASLCGWPRPVYQFKDVARLGDEDAVDVATGGLITLPGCHLFIAGFECDNVSRLNNKRLMSCIQDASGTTGTTFRGVLSYASHKRPMAMLLENVRGLGRPCSTHALLLHSFWRVCFRSAHWQPLAHAATP